MSYNFGIKRFGHYHHQVLVQWSKQGLSLDVPKLDDQISNCNACQFGEQNKKYFLKMA